MRSLSKAELVEELRRRQSDEQRADPDRLIASLQAQQVELDLQNEALRQAQHILEQTRATYTDLYDFAPVAYLTLDVHGLVTQINLTGARLFGHSKAMLEGKPFVAAARLRDSRAFWAHLNRCVEEAQLVTSEIVVDIGGEARAMQIVSTPLFAFDAVVSGCRSALVDVSERKRSEEIARDASRAAESARAHFSLLSDVSALVAEPISTAEFLLRVAHLSVPRIADGCVIELLGGGAEAPWTVAWADPERREQAALLRGRVSFAGRVARTGEPELHAFADDVFLARVAGNAEHLALLRAFGLVSCLVVPITARGRILGALTLATAESRRRFDDSDLVMAVMLGRRIGDTLDHWRLHADLVRTRASRDDMVRMVSHDLQNGLAAIAMHAGGLLETSITGSDRASVEAIERAARQTNRLMDDLVDFVRIEAGNLALTRRAEDPVALINGVVGELARLAQSKRIRLETKFTDAQFLVDCDGGRISQVLTNLVGNAIKFTPHGGRVTVELRLHFDTAVVVVADSGPGIPQAQRLHVFDKYWRASQETMGAGLGLFIAKTIIDAHRERIWVEQAMGGGALFFFTLARARRPDEASSATATDDAGGGDGGR
jgi:PAS domain S-box-containing protein